MKQNMTDCAFLIAGLFPAAVVRVVKPGFIYDMPLHRIVVLKLKPRS
jgi:hypothetical protein